MASICFYFQVHQPKRLRKYSYFDIGNNHYYEDDENNRNILLKIAHKCYIPTCTLLLMLIKKYPNVFKISFSLSGVFIEQCQRFCPEVLDWFKKLVDTEQVEILNETYYHSLSFIFSKDEFRRQVVMHRQLIDEIFDYKTTTFRNTELIYNNELAQVVESMGYNAILAEGADKILGWKSPNYVYTPEGCDEIKLLLRNYSLTDDIAFRFSEKNWCEHPICANKYANWLHSLHGQADLINLFMDFETFGEHHWKDSGIFNFLHNLPEYILKHPEYDFVTPKEVANRFSAVGSLNVPQFISWADLDRDLSAWYGNHLQEDALQSIYALAKEVYTLQDPFLTDIWRSLLTSDHFYYMCTKYDADGDVHKYFSPYSGPYEAYINYQNVVSDFIMVLGERKKQLQSVTESHGWLIDFWKIIGKRLGVIC